MRMNKKKSIQDGRLHSQRTIQQTILSWSSLDVSFHLTMEFILTVRLQFHDPSCQPCALRNSIEPQWRQRCPPRHSIGRQPCVLGVHFQLYVLCVCVCEHFFHYHDVPGCIYTLQSVKFKWRSEHECYHLTPKLAVTASHAESLNCDWILCSLASFIPFTAMTI